MMMSMAKGGGMPGHAGHARHGRSASAPRPGRPAGQEGQGQARLRQPGQARRRAGRSSRDAEAGRRQPVRARPPDGDAAELRPVGTSSCPPTWTKYLEVAAYRCRAIRPPRIGSVPRMADALRFRGPVLPDGERRDLYVVDGRVTYEPQSRRPSWSPRAGSCPGWSTRTATSASTSTAASATRTCRAAGARRPRRRRAAAARLRVRRSTPLDPRPRRPAAADPGRPAHRPHPALHPQLRPRDRARRAAGVRRPGGAARRRLGQARRRLDRARRRRPDAVVARGVARTRRSRPRTRTAPGSPPTCFGEAALPGPDRRRHRLHRARHRALDRPDRRDGRSGASRWCRPSCSSTTSRATPTRRPAKFPAYADHMRDLHARRRDTIMAAYEAGVAIYAGTDAGGVLPARPDRRRGARAGGLRVHAGRRPRRGVLAGARLARPRRQPGRGHHRGLRGLRPRPAARTSACCADPPRVVLRGAVVA